MSSTLHIRKSKSWSWWSPGCTTWCVTCSGSISLPSFLMTASLRAAAHRWDMPALAEVGGSTTPGGIKPSLPVNQSRIPGKKIASRGWSTASPSITRRNTAGSWIPGAWMASHILLAWAHSVQESSSIISRDSDWELSSRRHLWRNPYRSSLAVPSSIRGRFTFREMDCWGF